MVPTAFCIAADRMDHRFKKRIWREAPLDLEPES